MANLVKYQPQELVQVDRRTSRELARVQSDVAYITATTRVVQEHIGEMYRNGVRQAVDDLTYMNRLVTEAVEGGMPPGQVEMIHAESYRYLEFQKAATERGATALIRRALPD